MSESPWTVLLGYISPNARCY